MTQPTTMIERGAQSIRGLVIRCQAEGGTITDIDMARAVIRTLLEPSEEMIQQGESAATIGIGKPVDGEAVPRVFRAMILSALGEGDPA